MEGSIMVLLKLGLLCDTTISCTSCYAFFWSIKMAVLFPDSLKIVLLTSSMKEHIIFSSDWVPVPGCSCDFAYIFVARISAVLEQWVWASGKGRVGNLCSFSSHLCSPLEICQQGPRGIFFFAFLKHLTKSPKLYLRCIKILNRDTLWPWYDNNNKKSIAIQFGLGYKNQLCRLFPVSLTLISWIRYGSLGKTFQ